MSLEESKSLGRKYGVLVGCGLELEGEKFRNYVVNIEGGT